MIAGSLESIRNTLDREGLEILDCHAHIGQFFDFTIPEPDADALVRTMDLVGIRCSFASSLVGVADENLGHAEIIDAANRHPGRVMPVPIANPNRPEAALQYLELCRSDSRVLMVKVHPALHDYPVTGDNYRPIFEFAAAARWPILSHTWRGGVEPQFFDSLASAHPTAVFILGHSGGDIAGIRQAVQVARAHSNIYLDLAASMVYDGAVEWMVDQVGDHRVLFGSDATFLDPRPQYGRVLYARIPAQSKIAIFGANLRRLLEDMAGRPIEM